MLPTQLIRPMDAAAAASLSTAVGKAQKGGRKVQTNPAAMVKKIIATANCERAATLAARAAPEINNGTAACQRRSRLRSDLQPVTTSVMTPSRYGTAVMSVTV